jgi:hypothetical protein
MFNVPGLDAYVGDEGARPFVWGRRDCILFAAGWVQARTGRDPAAAWRGRYDTGFRAHHLLAQAGGITAAISREMAALGFALTSDPLPGDVGLVSVPTAVRGDRVRTETGGAIRVGRLWAVKGRRGLAGADFPCLAAWSIDPREDEA